jgi:hypothetical protein
MKKLIGSVVDWARWYKKEIIFGMIIFVVASLSFALGYLANRQFNHAEIVIEKGAVSSKQR